MAITWQNVSGPSVAQAASSLGDAQKTFSGMFSGIDDILKKREAMETANWDQGKLNNTNAFLNAVQGAKTPEEYAAMEAGLREQFAGYGAQIDTAAGRNALDGRRAILQQRGLAEQQYTDQKQEVEQRTPLAMFRAAMMNAKTPEDAAAIQAGAQSAFGNGTLTPKSSNDLQQYALERSKNLVDQGRATSEFGEKEKKWAQDALTRPLEIDKLKSDLSTAEVNRATLRAQAAAAGNSSALALANLEDRRTAQDALKLQASAQARLKGTMYEGGTYTPSDSIELGDLLAKNKGLDAGEQSRVLDRINKLASEGIVVPFTNAEGVIDTRRVPIPKSLIKGIVASARDDEYVTAPWNWSQAGANFVETRLKEALKATETYKNGEGKDVVRYPAIDGYELLLSGQANAINNPAIATGKGGTASPKPPGEYKSPKPRRTDKD